MSVKSGWKKKKKNKNKNKNKVMMMMMMDGPAIIATHRTISWLDN